MKRNAHTHDLSQHLQQQLGDVIARHVAIMRHALPTGEIGIVLIEAAVSLNLTAAATIAASFEDRDTADTFDSALAAIAAMAAADRERSLAKVAERKAKA